MSINHKNGERNKKIKFNYSFKIITKDNKEMNIIIYTHRFEFTEVLNFLNTKNIIIQTSYYDETAPGD